VNRGVCNIRDQSYRSVSCSIGSYGILRVLEIVPQAVKDFASGSSES
jgi:hypothetical protein